MPHLLVSSVHTHTPTQPPPPSSAFQFLYIKMEGYKLPPNPVWFHPSWPHMGLWSAFHPESLALFSPPPHSTLSLVSKFTLVPLEKAMIRYLSFHGNAGLRGISCVRRYTHAHSRTELYFHNLSRASGSGVVVVGWWRWAWG